jgi:LacI family transcriptional regulator
VKKPKSSIKDVALLAGVSTATVSHVINKTRFVSEETSRKVNEVITELEYLPSAAARGLAGKESKIISVIFSDISNPFFTSVFMGLESVLAGEGYELILVNTGEEIENQEKALRTMLSRQIDGLIIAPTGRESHMLNQLVDVGIPVVLIDREAPVDNVFLVDLDNEYAAHQAITHLINDGHQQIGVLLGLPEVSTTRTRLNGYQKAIDEHNIPFRPEYLFQGHSRIEGGYEGVKYFLDLDQPPTAIFSMNNMMTLGVLHAFKEIGIECPNDLGLVGFDDHDWGNIFTPSLTVVRQPTYEMGVIAAKMLISNTESTYRNHERLTGELVIRESCSKKCQQHFKKNISHKFIPKSE